jgi:hypothetical protein
VVFPLISSWDILHHHIIYLFNFTLLRTGQALVIACLWLCTLTLFAQAPSYLWATASGRYNTTPVSAWGRAVATKTVVDAAGNTYVVGSFTGVARFDALALTSAGGNDVFVAKLDGAGNYVWAVGAGGTENDDGIGLALDTQGHLYITGAFRRTASFGGSVLVSAGFRDVFVAQLSASTGAWAWTTRGGGSDDEVGQGVATDGNNVFVTGALGSSPAVFGGTTLVNTVSSSYPPFALVGKLTTGGAWLWATSSSSPGAGQASSILATGIVADGSGGAYIVGEFSYVVDFGSIRLFVNRPSTPGYSSSATDLFVARVAPNGGWQWAIGAGGFGYETAASLALGPGGTLVIAGHSNSSSVTFGATPPLVIPISPINASDVIVAKLTSAGNFVWSTHGGGTGSETSADLVVDPAGDIYVAGAFGPAPSQFGASTLASVGGQDAFVAKLNGNGVWQWGVSGGSRDNDTGATGVGVDGTGNVSVVGAFPNVGGAPRNDAVFGPYTVAGNMGYTTGVVARLGAPLSTRISGDSLLCAGGQVQLLATPSATALAFAWSTGATTSSITVNQPGTYSVQVSFAGGRSATATFVVRALVPQVRILGDTALCPGTPLRLTANAASGAAYRWNTGATSPTLDVTQPGVYTLTARYGAGCVVTTQRTVTSPTVTISGGGALCPGASLVLTATASSPATFRWSTGAAGPSLGVTQPGTYSVTATLLTGCSLTTSRVVAAPVAAIQGDSVLCAGKAVGLNALDGSALSYQWSTGATTPAITVAQPGLYAVVLTYPGGCNRQARVRVQLGAENPPFTLGNDTTLCWGGALVLRAPAAPAAGVTYRWSDGSTGTTLRVSAPGAYSLERRTACGNQTALRRVVAADCLLIPNIITPNRDGINDRFQINGLPPGAWELTLFNRWGRQVFATKDYHQDWGEEAAFGMYYYVLKQANTRYKGVVEVIR